MTPTEVARARLGATHVPTGKTKHRLGDVELPAPSALRILQYGGDPGFYLLYLDEAGAEIADTYHSSLEGAFEQADFELGIKPHEWTR